MNPSIDYSPLCTVLEEAQAAQNMAVARTLAQVSPASKAEVLELPGGLGVFLGEGHPLTQGLALGLRAPLEPDDLDRLEAFLGRGGHPPVLELTPGADLELYEELGRRGYSVRQFQQVWLRVDLGDIRAGRPARPDVSVRPATPEEAGLAARLIDAGFMDLGDVLPEGMPTLLPPCSIPGSSVWISWLGDEPAGGGTLHVSGKVAVLSGTAVLPRFRGLGLQRDLVRARLEAASRQGAEVAVSVTAPWSTSSANLQREGFGPAYPKLEMERLSPDD